MASKSVVIMMMIILNKRSSLNNIIDSKLAPKRRQYVICVGHWNVKERAINAYHSAFAF